MVLALALALTLALDHHIVFCPKNYTSACAGTLSSPPPRPLHSNFIRFSSPLINQPSWHTTVVRNTTVTQ